MTAGVRIAATCLAAFLVLPVHAPAAAPGSPASAALFAEAEEMFEALRVNTAAQRQRQNFTRVLEAYRRVFEKYPSTRQGDTSLMRAGELQTLLFRWTGQEGDLNRAQNYYQRLVQTAPKSALVDDALLAIAYLHLDHFKDPAQAWLRFRDVTLLAPAGDKAAEAKRQLKRLAAYASADKPPPAAGAADLPCPVPPAQPVISNPSPAIIAAPPPPVIALPARELISAQQSGGEALSPRPPAPPPTPGAPAVLNRVRGIRHWSNPEYSRVVIDLDQKTNFYSNLLEDRSGSGASPRLYIDLFSSLVEERFCRPIAVNDGILHGVRAGQYTPDSVRVVLDIDGLSTYRVFPMQDPFRIVIDVTGGAPAAVATAAAASSDTTAAASAPEAPEAVARKETTPPSTLPPPGAPAPRFAPEPVPELIPLPSFASTSMPQRTTPTATEPPAPAPPPAAPPAGSPPVTFSGVAAAPAPAPAPPPLKSAAPAPALAPARKAAAPTASGKPSLARQLGLGVRRVVIDAGHGAHDPGAIGVGGLQEKDVTLDLALRVRDILRTAGYETVLTRDRDVYLPLEERTAIANTARGDLFLSLHCNASDAGNLSGVETYFLNLASNVRSMQTAARENSMAVANMSDLQKIVREIQNSKMDESSQFAARVQRSLHDTLHRKYPDVKNLGVKQAPFYVLIGAQMPSVLAEVSFINHRKEGRRLADPAYRQLIAQALADGVKRYVRTVKTAALAVPGKPTP